MSRARDPIILPLLFELGDIWQEEYPNVFANGLPIAAKT